MQKQTSNKVIRLERLEELASKKLNLIVDEFRFNSELLAQQIKVKRLMAQLAKENKVLGDMIKSEHTKNKRMVRNHKKFMQRYSNLKVSLKNGENDE